MGSHLSSEQLGEITSKINKRLKEFQLGHIMELSPGVVRLAYEVFEDWQNASKPAASTLQPVTAAKSNGAYTIPAPLVPRRTRTIAEVDAELDAEFEDDFDADADEDGDEPEGRVYKTSEEERRRAKEYRQRHRGEHSKPEAEARGKSGNVLPTIEEIIAEVQRISMDKKTMPTRAAFDDARPGNWATSDAQIRRFSLTWSQLADMAGLTPRLPGRPVAEE